MGFGWNDYFNICYNCIKLFSVFIVFYFWGVCLIKYVEIFMKYINDEDDYSKYYLKKIFIKWYGYINIFLNDLNYERV